MLTRAIVLAAQAHEGQLDKADEPYIMHPLRLMLQLDSEEERIIALLHDVVEDTELTLQDLRREGFSEKIVAAIDSLTRRDGEEYEDYIERLMKNPAAVPIKLLDLRDNQDTTRIHEETEETKQRMEKYRKAEQKILQSTSKD